MKVQLTANSTSREILDVLTTYIPYLSNVTEILNDLHALRLSQDGIKKVLLGSSTYIFGEIGPTRPSNRKIIISGASVFLAEINGAYRVCLDGLPVDSFINKELNKQKELETISKEELVKENQILRSTVKSSADRIKVLEDHIATLKKGIGI